MEIEIFVAFAILFVMVFLATIDMAFSRLSDVSLRRLAADVEADDKKTSADLLREILENRPRFRFALSSSIQILLIGFAVLLTLLILRFVENRSLLMILALAFGLASTVIFRQILPRVFITNNPDKKLLFLLPIVRPLYSISSAVTRPFTTRATAKEMHRIDSTIPPDLQDDRAEDNNDDFQALMEVGEAEGIIEGKERELIETLVEFGDTKASEIMTPRTDICGLSIDSTIQNARDLIIEQKYSRLPVYRDSIDNIEGMVYVRDLLQAWAEGNEEKPVSTLLRDAFFVPETKTASELLKDMQANHVQISIVIDEYGGVAGLVTVEDLLEEIVGEIEDEDTEQEEIVEIVQGEDGYWDVLGSTEIDKIERIFGTDLDDEDYTTIAGLVTSEAGYVPKVGDKLTLRGLAVEIIKADEKKLHLIRLRKAEQSETDDEDAAE